MKVNGGQFFMLGNFPRSIKMEFFMFGSLGLRLQKLLGLV